MSIAIKKSHKGLLHKDTGTPQSKPIAAADLMKALHSGSAAVRKRANFAKVAKTWSHAK